MWYNNATTHIWSYNKSQTTQYIQDNTTSVICNIIIQVHKYEHAAN